MGALRRWIAPYGGRDVIVAAAANVVIRLASRRYRMMERGLRIRGMQAAAEDDGKALIMADETEDEKKLREAVEEARKVTAARGEKGAANANVDKLGRKAAKDTEDRTKNKKGK